MNVSWNVYIWQVVKCKYLRAGFELGSAIPSPPMTTVMLGKD